MAVFDKSRINGLTIKHILGTLTDGEQAELDQFLDGEPGRRERFAERVRKSRMQPALQSYLEAEAYRMQHSTAPARRRRIRRRMVYGAALLLMAGGVFLLVQKQTPVDTAGMRTHTGQDVLPGSNKAVLTLEDGTTIDLDAAKMGTVSQQGQTRISKTDSSGVVYTAGSNNKALKPGGPLAYNIITTPRGGSYQVALADGSIAWLNAASSIRFPVSFAADRREVEITGEVFFDVKRNAAAPFRVHAADAMVEVLGTEFNIRTYNNEPAANITLLSGAVEVSQGKSVAAPGQMPGHVAAHKVRLAPGQQARLTGTGAPEVVNNADIEQAVAWRSGFFKFKNADIRSVMREVERWYDISVSYQITDYSEKYGGRISRNLTLAELLRLLEGNHIHHYKMEGKNITVLP